MTKCFSISAHVGIFFLLFIPTSTFSQQDSDTSNRKPHVIRQDTSEEALVKQFRNMMDNSETVMDAQVISMESKWGLDKDWAFPNGRREIYTVITFKVFHWIKGSLSGDEIRFYNGGGKIGDTEMVVTPTRIYNLKERAIFFLANKDSNTYLLDRGRMEIFGSENGSRGLIFLGTFKVDPEHYISLVKKSVTDTTAYPKYVHMLKAADEERRIRDLKWKDGVMPRDVADSVHRAIRQEMLGKNDTTKGGVK